MLANKVGVPLVMCALPHSNVHHSSLAIALQTRGPLVRLVALLPAYVYRVVIDVSAILKPNRLPNLMGSHFLGLLRQTLALGSQRKFRFVVALSTHWLCEIDLRWLDEALTLSAVVERHSHVHWSCYHSTPAHRQVVESSMFLIGVS